MPKEKGNMEETKGKEEKVIGMEKGEKGTIGKVCVQDDTDLGLDNAGSDLRRALRQHHGPYP